MITHAAVLNTRMCAKYRIVYNNKNDTLSFMEAQKPDMAETANKIQKALIK